MADSAQKQDQPFLHYSRKHRLIAWISIKLFDNVSYTVRHGLIKGMKRKGGLGWAPEFIAGSTETAESRYWTRLDLKGKTVYDIGSFHGLLALFFARRAARVICFEPNTRNHRRLMENLALNQCTNVTVRQVGVGSRKETLTMAGNPLMPGGSSVDRKTIDGLERSGTDMVAEQIQIVTLDDEIAASGLPPPDFIKIDIEGWEIDALRGARRTIEKHGPELFLEMHGETMREKQEKVTAIANFLSEMNYRNILHVETGVAITPANALVAVEGHLHARLR